MDALAELVDLLFSLTDVLAQLLHVLNELSYFLILFGRLSDQNPEEADQIDVKE